MTDETQNNNTIAGEDARFSSHSASFNIVTAVWLILMVATVLSWWLAGIADLTEAGVRTLELAAIIAIAVLKMYLVIAVFMGISAGPANWHIGLAGCLLVIGGVTFYFALQT